MRSIQHKFGFLPTYQYKPLYNFIFSYIIFNTCNIIYYSVRYFVYIQYNLLVSPSFTHNVENQKVWAPVLHNVKLPG